MTLVKAFAIVMGLARNSDSAHKHASSSLRSTERHESAREILYTVLSADEKDSSKIFLDTFSHWSGDEVGA